MKLRPEQMFVFPLDYGELIRPPFEILTGRGWGQCTNATHEFLIVYGPKHETERSIFDTTPYVLPSGATTPDRWDCEGFFLPSDRQLRSRWGTQPGPLAIKFWNFRHFTVRQTDPVGYASFWPNAIFQASQVNWAIPNLTYEAVQGRIRSIGATNAP